MPLKILRHTRLITLVLLTLAGNALAEVTLTPLDVSSRILHSGDPVQVQLLLHNAVTTPLDGEVAVVLVDFQGKKAGGAVKPVSIPAGDDRLITLNPTPNIPGCFSVDAKVTSGAAVVLERKALWSLAILEPGFVVPENSPFGTYTIGNTKMLADIVPKGFYRDMAALGARWGTVDTWWSRIEVVEGNRDWAFYEQWFDAARKDGLVPIPHLFGIPQWISSHPESEDYWAYPPRDWGVWEKFVSDFVARYQSWLVYLRIWNEPNCGFWRGTPADYAQLVLHASQAAKRVKPDLKIIIEAVANADLNVLPFFDAVDATGATPAWDVLGVHNYWLNSRDCPERTPFLKVYQDVLAWRNAHKPGAPVWDTEFACMADDWGTQWFGVGEMKQAQWLARAYVLGFSLGLEKMFWFPGYSWPDPTTPPFYNPAGLLRPDLSPRPAAVAFHTVAAALSEAKYERTLPLDNGRYGIVFKTPAGFTTALWSVDAACAGKCDLRFGEDTQVLLTGLMGEKRIMAVPENGVVMVSLDENVVFVASKTVPSL